MINKSVKISIVLPVYNGERYLKYSINSILEQTFTDWELIIVDDCSCDNTSDIINEYINIDNRIYCIRNEKNLKIPGSLNVGFAKAKGEYLTWTSDDNMYDKNALEVMNHYLDHNKEKVMVYASCRLMDDHGTGIPGAWGEKKPTPLGLLRENTCGACFLYRASAAQKVGLYDQSAFLAEDHDYWLRMMLVGEIGHISEELYSYRKHKHNLSNNKWREAHCKSDFLAQKYYLEFDRKFPDLNIKKEMSLRLMYLDCSDEKFYNIKKIFFKKDIHKELKRAWKLTGDIKFLRYMCKLSPFLCFKALSLYLRKKED